MKIKVGILGATGTIGQNLVHLLHNHPYFEVAFLGASSEKRYDEAVSKSWPFHESPPKLLTHDVHDIVSAKNKCSLVFSALPASLAKTLEEEYANAGFAVVSSAGAHRMSPDVPLLIPEINPEHLCLIDAQRKRRNGQGFIITKPNCAIQSFILPLTPLHKTFGIDNLHITTLQAISGAGNSSLASSEIHDNVIPYIDGEEEKVEAEPKKIWDAPTLNIAAHCNRVPVLHGHHACVTVSFKKRPSKEEIFSLWEGFKGEILPSSPSKLITYLDDERRPQNRLDVMREKGMGVTVGRLRESSLFDYRFVALSHNALRGGAGGAILSAELLYKKGYLS